MFIDLTGYKNIEGVTMTFYESRINLNSIDLIRFEVKTMALKEGKPIPHLNPFQYKKEPGSVIDECNHITLKKWQPPTDLSTEDITITFSQAANSYFEKFKSIIDNNTL